MLISISSVDHDRVQRLWRTLLVMPHGAPVPRTLTGTANKCVEIGLDLFCKKIEVSPGLVSEQRRLGARMTGVRVHLAISSKFLKKCDILCLSFMPGADSLGRMRRITKHGLLIWALEDGIDASERALGSFGRPVKFDEFGCAVPA